MVFALQSVRDKGAGYRDQGCKTGPRCVKVVFVSFGCVVLCLFRLCLRPLGVVVLRLAVEAAVEALAPRLGAADRPACSVLRMRGCDSPIHLI